MRKIVFAGIVKGNRQEMIPKKTITEVQGKTAQMAAVVVAMLLFFIGCSSAPKTSLDTKGVPTTLFGLLPKPSTEKPVEETLPENVPSFEHNKTYKDIDGFPDYIVGVGDVITISLSKAGGLESSDITVPPSGKISYSFLDNVQVVGRTVMEVANEISKALEVYVKKPRVNVVVKEYNSKKVFLLGEIARIEGLLQSGPGVYPLKGKTSLLKLLVAVGGHTTKADLSRVEFTREGKLYGINLYKIMSFGGVDQDIVLENGDRVLIPQFHAYIEEQTIKCRVYVLGEVRWPNLIESKTDLTVLEALSRVQGLTPMAHKSKARIVRGDIRNPEVVPIDLKKLIDKSDISLNVMLQNGDVLYVPTTLLGKFANAFTQITPVLNAFTYPAIYRDLYTTGGIGVYDTGPRPTGGGTGGTGQRVTTETLLGR